MYIGSKGYTIPKHLLNESEISMIKNDLTIKTNGNYQQSTIFPVYRESTNKLYVPRFYGISKYGIVDKQLKEGQTIELEFNGVLRDIQLPVVNAYIECAKTKGCGLIELPCGFGKTIIALYITYCLNKKTLVIVHKEFLLEQWKERIQEFLPNAKIGRIQGNTIDIHGKDIVIGMLQSLSMKEYPKQIFDEFGFTIIDETHHIAAEVFSNALFKIVTPYMLGLSATMERKDGLTKVFQLFLGDIEYKVIREKTNNVIVNAIYFNSQDSEYNEPILNHKGQNHYTAMISKISNYKPRIMFIMDIIHILLKDELNVQIMILSHTKAVLQELYKEIEQISSVGYYIGGMKQNDLKNSETKKFILATYAMAEEALDIKTLTTLIMITPKTNVTQSVGRILRSNHERPLIIDIIDRHDVFIRQWYLRKKFYQQNNYKIVYSSNDKYPIMTEEKEKKKKCNLDLSKFN